MSDDAAARLSRLSSAQRAVLERMLNEQRPTTPERTAPCTPIEQQLVQIWREVLGTQEIGVHDNFYALGGDSIASLQVAARAAGAGLRITSQQVMTEETIARLALVAETGPGAVPAARPDDPVGEVRLTPIQRWFFEQDIPESHHWDQAILVELRPATDDGLVRAALREVAGHHDALRSTFRSRGGSWVHVVAAQGPDPAYRVVELGGLTVEEQDARMRAAITSAQQEVDLTHGPLVSAVFFRLGRERPDRLLVAVHHLVVDGVSVRIIMEDLARAYAALAAGEPMRLPPKTTSFRTWSHALARHARSSQVCKELEYWRSVPDPRAAAAVGVTSVPGPNPANTQGGSRTLTTDVAGPTVAALRAGSPGARGAQVRDVLLAALLVAWGRWSGQYMLQLDLEGHGREPFAEHLDVTRTTGWFTTIHPVVLTLRDDEGASAAIQAVRRRLQAVPGNGLGYGLLRYMGGGQGRVLADLPQSRISFNYLGWFNRPGGDSVLGPPLQVPALLQSAHAPRRYLLDIVVTGVEERMTVDWIHAGDYYEAGAIRDLAAHFRDTLDDFVAAPRRQSDDPLAAISRQIGFSAR